MVEAMVDLKLDDTLKALEQAFPKVTLDVTVPEE